MPPTSELLGIEQRRPSVPRHTSVCDFGCDLKQQVVLNIPSLVQVAIFTSHCGRRGSETLQVRTVGAGTASRGVSASEASSRRPDPAETESGPSRIPGRQFKKRKKVMFPELIKPRAERQQALRKSQRARSRSQRPSSCELMLLL